MQLKKVFKENNLKALWIILTFIFLLDFNSSQAVPACPVESSGLNKNDLFYVAAGGALRNFVFGLQ